jgi:hypothetical protein
VPSSASFAFALLLLPRRFRSPRNSDVPYLPPALSRNEALARRHQAAVIGAVTLYLDFINLFLFLLRIMGSRR